MTDDGELPQTRRSFSGPISVVRQRLAAVIPPPAGLEVLDPVQSFRFSVSSDVYSAQMALAAV